MNHLLVYFFLTVLALCVCATFFFRDAVRSTASAGVGVSAIAALMAYEGAQLMSGFFLLTFVGSIVFFHLLTTVLLNIQDEELGSRRLTFQAILIVFLLGYLTSASLGLLDERAPMKEKSRHVEAFGGVGHHLLNDYGLVLSITSMVFLSTIIGVFLISRRRI